MCMNILILVNFRGHNLCSQVEFVSCRAMNIRVYRLT